MLRDQDCFLAGRVRKWRIEALPYRVCEFLELSGLQGRLAKANGEYRALVVESYRSRQ